MPEDSQELRMTFTPNTIEHLGVRMYATLPPVIAELIANSYDADANEVHIHLKDGGEKEIHISDNGHGMTFAEINDKFLRIGRNRRSDEHAQTSPRGRKVIGKKGLGKLSFFGISHEIEVATVKDGKLNRFIMKWDDILSYEDKNKQQNYAPTVLDYDVHTHEHHGTRIVLKSIQRITDFDASALADSLSKIFIIDPDFKIFVRRNDEHELIINNERKYSALTSEIRWEVPRDIGLTTTYSKAGDIRGHLIATEKPISPNTNLRGITLFSRRKLVNAPEYFSDSTSSHFYSYLTGWLEVDFIDDLDEDVIGTNRQSLNWLHPDMKELRKYLQDMLKWLERDWREKRAQIREDKIASATGIDIKEWYEKLPESIRDKVKPIVDSIVKESELTSVIGTQAIKNFHDIVPEYPSYHWRHLHTQVREASETDYRSEDYYRAFLEASKRYINAVRAKSGSSNPSESGMMGDSFGDGARALKVANGYLKRDGQPFSTPTLNNIEAGQKHLSMGVVSGCRNPVSHEEIQDLKTSGLFSEKDCLDALSMLSHLFHRLDNAPTTQ